MAQVTVLNPTRYFCHRCNVEINPNLQDFTCPTCMLGFIEEMTAERTAAVEPAETSRSESRGAETSLLMGPVLFQALSNAQSSSLSNDEQSSSSQSSEPGTSTSQRIRYYPRYPSSRRRTLRNRGTNGQFQVWEHVDSVLFRLTRGSTAPLSLESLVGLHGNPGDYAWGADGYDNIIARLLSQLDDSGPPPASDERIAAMPLIDIGADEIARRDQCSVCFEEFQVQTKACQMPCKHIFHQDCIVPWLKRHDTCPVCRKNLQGENTASNTPLPPPPPDSNGGADPAGSSSSSTSSPGAERHRRGRYYRFQIN